MVCLNNCKLANQSNAIIINSFKNPYKLSHRSLIFSLSCASHIMGIFSWLFCLRRMRVVLVRVRLNFPIISIYLLNVRIISKIHNKLFILIYGFYIKLVLYALSCRPIMLLPRCNFVWPSCALGACVIYFCTNVTYYCILVNNDEFHVVIWHVSLQCDEMFFYNHRSNLCVRPLKFYKAMPLLKGQLLQNSNICRLH